MKTISVAELRQNPTEALEGVQAGATYVVTRHRHPVAKLMPHDADATSIIPPRVTGPARLRERLGKRTYTHEQVETLLDEMSEDR